MTVTIVGKRFAIGITTEGIEVMIKERTRERIEERTGEMIQETTKETDIVLHLMEVVDTAVTSRKNFLKRM